MKKFITTLLVSFAVIAAYAIAPDAVINPHIDNPKDYVSDMADVLTDAEEDSINVLCFKLDSLAGMELAVVTIDSLGDEDPFDYSVAVYENFGIGKNDNGILIFAAIADHKWEIRTGYTAEGQLTDALCSNIGRTKMVPKFRENDYGGGIYDAVQEIFNVAFDAEAMAALQEAVEEENKTADKAESFSTGTTIIIFVIAIVVIVLLVRRNRTKCPKCGKQSTKKLSENTLEEATYDKKGKKETTYQCKKCGEVFTIVSIIPMLTHAVSSTTSTDTSNDSNDTDDDPSGSFGGGHTGGGGAGGSW